MVARWTRVVPLLVAFSAVSADAIAWCKAMGGYPSFEAQAEARRRAAAATAAVSRSSSDGGGGSWRPAPSRQVEDDQQGLRQLGYYKGDVDGVPGSGTRNAIRDFRKANGLGNATTLSPQARALIRDGKAVSKREYDQVVSDQTALKDLGYYNGNIDGRAGNATKAAVSAFRQANGLSEGTTLDESARRLILEGKALKKGETRRVSGAAQQPEAQQPEAQQPEAPQPEAQQPGAQQPGAQQPEALE